MRMKHRRLMSLFICCIIILLTMPIVAFGDATINVNSWENLRNALKGDGNATVMLTD